MALFRLHLLRGRWNGGRKSRMTWDSFSRRNKEKEKCSGLLKIIENRTTVTGVKIKEQYSRLWFSTNSWVTLESYIASLDLIFLICKTGWNFELEILISKVISSSNTLSVWGSNDKEQYVVICLQWSWFMPSVLSLHIFTLRVSWFGP